jgi:hypothetical protein
LLFLALFLICCDQKNLNAMKTNKLTTTKNHPIVLGSLLLFLLAFSSCMDADYFPCVRPNGNIAEETRSTTAFTGVELRLHGQVFITSGADYSVSIETSENLFGMIHTRIVGGKLIIEQDRCIRCRVDDINIYITMPEIRELNLAGSGRFFLDDEWDTEELDLNVSGSGRITGTFTADRINTRISGSGNVVLDGTTKDHYIQISGSGKVEGTDMVSRNAEVRISGSGSARIHVTNYLDARITGSGSIYFTGDPAIDSRITGTGRIIKY